jgi:DNA-binding NarL/FixJ family response regulator
LVDRLLVVSARNDEQSHQVLRQVPIAGFFDCLSEDTDNLGIAIRRVGSGGRYFSASSLVPGGARRPTLNQILSQTELQVLAVIGDGSSDQDAADCLGLSATTVHCHRQHIMHKLDIQTRAALMRTAIERGVIRFSADRVLRPGMERILAGRSLSVLSSEPGRNPRLVG